jgi:hypothetical protein
MGNIDTFARGTSGFAVRDLSPGDLSPLERAAFGIFDTTPAGVQRNNRSEWRPVTEREEPEARPLDFVLTPRERDVATMAALHLENRRRRMNELDEAQPFIVRDPRKGGEL